MAKIIYGPNHSPTLKPLLAAKEPDTCSLCGERLPTHHAFCASLHYSGDNLAAIKACADQLVPLDLCLNPACGKPALLITGYCEAHSVEALTDNETPEEGWVEVKLVESLDPNEHADRRREAETRPTERPPTLPAAIEMAEELRQLRSKRATSLRGALKIHTQLKQAKDWVTKLWPAGEAQELLDILDAAVVTNDVLLLLLGAADPGVHNG